MTKSANQDLYLTSANLVLRAPRKADVDLMEKGVREQSLPSDSRHDMFARIATQATDLRTFLRDMLAEPTGDPTRNPGIRGLILSRDEGAFLGMVSIYDAKLNVQSAAMDCYVLNQHWRRGIATEAVKTALAACFGAGLHRIETTIETGNTPSIRFAEKLGMKFEGVRREGAFINGQWRDLCVYSTLQGEIV